VSAEKVANPSLAEQITAAYRGRGPGAV